MNTYCAVLVNSSEEAMKAKHAAAVAEIEALFATYYPNVPKVISAQSLEALDTLATRDTLKRMRASWQTIVNQFAVPVGHLATRPSMSATEVQARIEEAASRLVRPMATSMEIVRQAVTKIGENDV